MKPSKVEAKIKELAKKDLPKIKEEALSKAAYLN